MTLIIIVPALTCGNVWTHCCFIVLVNKHFVDLGAQLELYVVGVQGLLGGGDDIKLNSASRTGF